MNAQCGTEYTSRVLTKILFSFSNFSLTSSKNSHKFSRNKNDSTASWKYTVKGHVGTSSFELFGEEINNTPENVFNAIDKNVKREK